ncbi:MAG TPA: hypothetical protein V6C85_24000, partial [Allocoleopsis sp.]
LLRQCCDRFQSEFARFQPRYPQNKPSSQDYLSQHFGLLDPGTLPVVGIDSARKAIDPNLPSNALIDRGCVRDEV